MTDEERERQGRKAMTLDQRNEEAMLARLRGSAEVTQYDRIKAAKTIERLTSERDAQSDAYDKVKGHAGTPNLTSIQVAMEIVLEALQKQDTCNENAPWPEVVIDPDHNDAVWTEAALRLVRAGLAAATTSNPYYILQATGKGRKGS